MKDSTDQTLRDGYRRLISGLPIPSAEQIRAFSIYVSQAHSWYKHLPPLDPGTSFTFWLDPNAGCITEIQGDGQRKPVPLLPADARYHYSLLPTHEYRRRFGYLSFNRSLASVRLAPGASFEMASVAAARSTFEQRDLPPELLAVATVSLTGIIHPNSLHPLNPYFEILCEAINALPEGADLGALDRVKLLNLSPDPSEQDVIEALGAEHARQRAKLNAAVTAACAVCDQLQMTNQDDSLYSIWSSPRLD